MPQTTSPSAASTAAEALRAAREGRGESLTEAAAATRISEEYLDALERDAPLGAFPAPVYARFFLRQYARHLGLDEPPLLEAFGRRHGASHPPLPRGVAPAPAQSPRRGPWMQGAGTFFLTRTGQRGSRVARPAASGLKLFGDKRRKPGSRRFARSRAGNRRGTAALFVIAALAVVLALAVPRLVSGSQTDPRLEREPVAILPPAPPELPRGGQTIFPDSRVVAFYGAPNDPDLGVLGLGPSEAARRLLEQAEGYTFSPRPVLPAFELIGTLATRAAGPEGLYRARLDGTDIRRYLAEAREVRALFVIDIQPGRSDFMTEARIYEDLLAEPDVGLAIDPEWHVGPRQVPGVQLGSVDAASINQVIDYLAQIVRRHRLPQKLLIIHQFTEDMIRDKGRVKTVPEVAVTFDIDGFGDRANKIVKYQTFSQQFEKRFWHGFKLFYEQDVDLMTPLDVLGLRPTPDLVIYQ
jgi:hypothetical protein